MPTIIDSLVVTLGLDSSGFKKGQKEVGKGLKDTKDNADQTAKDMEAAGKKAASFFGSIRTELLALVGVTLSAAGVKTFISSMTNSLQNLGNTSQALDMSSRSLDGWQRAAEAAGSSAEKITSTLGSFQSTLTKIRTGQAGDDPLFAALANFGSATGANFDWHNDNAEAIMRKIAANWSKLSKDGRRAFGSMFGFDNATINSLNQGNLTRDADRFTQMSRATEEATRKAAEFNRRLTEMKQNFSAASQVLYEALIPYVEKLIPLIEKFGMWISTHGPEIQKFFSNSAKEIGQVVDAVGGVENALGILLAFVAGKWVLGMVGAISTVGTSLGALISNLASVVVKNPWLLMLVPTNNTPGTAEEMERAGGMGSNILPSRESAYMALRKENPGKDFFTDEEIQNKINEMSIEVSQRAQSAKKGTGKNTLAWMAPLFNQLETLYRLPEGMLNSIAMTESSGNQFAIGPQTKNGTAKGMFQFMDDTAKWLGMKDGDVFDPEKSANGAAKYMRHLLDATGGDIVKATAAYNWGIGNVQRKGLENAPAETQAYVPKVLGGIKLGAGSGVMRNSSSQQGPTTNINISKVDLATSANNAESLGSDLQRTVQRNRLVSPVMSGQG